MTWTTKISNRARRLADNLPQEISKIYEALKKALQQNGPHQPGWRHFKKLSGSGECYHCHLCAGRPTYVAVWRVIDKKNKVIEIRYVGTHEAAGEYRRRC